MGVLSQPRRNFLRPGAAIAVLTLLLAGSMVRAQQVELDRSVQKVYGSVIMASDVRQVRLLKLAGPEAGTDEAAQTAIENRMLMLREVAQGTGIVSEPPANRIAAKRDAWRSTWPPSTDFAALLTRAGMSEQALDAWFRDELRIEAYIEQRFPSPADTRRADRVASWINDLRRRANLSAK